jgi:hypothetical protein
MRDDGPVGSKNEAVGRCEFSGRNTSTNVKLPHWTTPVDVANYAAKNSSRYALCKAPLYRKHKRATVKKDRHFDSAIE